MSHFWLSWSAIPNATRQRLSWKLALSHLKVTLIAQLINLAGVGLILFAVGEVRMPFSSGEMAGLTRTLATALAVPLRTQSSAELSATLARLPVQSAADMEEANRILGPDIALVIVSPDGVVVASSTPDVPVGLASATLKPSVWGQVLEAARRGEQDSDSPALNQRDHAMSVLVSAYPLIDNQGQILGALGLRSGPVPLTTLDHEGTRVISLTVFFGTLFLLVSTLSSAVAAGIGVVLARSFGRRLQALTRATEAIAHGDLSARVAVSEPDEIGQIAVRFNELTERLDQVNRARRSFVSTISHELRTPLAIIRGHLEAQFRHTTDGILPREALEAIDRESRALGALIDDLFILTQLEEASLPIHTRAVSVQEIATGVVSGIRPLAARHGHVAVHSLLSADLPPVQADPIRLAQILNNLLYNALRYTPDGGVIVIEGQSTPDGTAIELAVTDTGVGIEPGELPYIFERFFRGSGTSAVGSSGLGLAIVKQLVEAQGGSIQAESVPHQGTTIRLTLPHAT